MLQPPRPPEPEEETPNTAIEVPGFGQKGEGKGANYGVGIPPPTVLRAEEYPAALRQPGSSSGSQRVQPLPLPPQVPQPIAARTEDVDEWISTDFSPLLNLSTKIPPEIGEEVLWRGVKTGKHRQASTKVEYFNGTVRYLECDSAVELFLYLV